LSRIGIKAELQRRSLARVVSGKNHCYDRVISANLSRGITTMTNTLTKLEKVAEGIMSLEEFLHYSFSTMMMALMHFMN
jgi:hypothetical protein